ncbi:MAG: hypothetical protein AAB631_00690 [Patescibacteria group bacterium]
MLKDKKTVVWGIGIVVVLIAGFSLPRIFGGSVGTGLEDSVPCLREGLPLVQHIHPTLPILVDGVAETIPAGIGLSPSCERAVHTHADDVARGVIHVESQDSRTYTLGDFFSVWDRPIIRDEYTLVVTVDGKLYSGPADQIPLKDLEEIRLAYTKE